MNQPPPLPPSAPPPPAASSSKGFFGRLFDLSFSEFVTPSIIKVIFIVGIVFAPSVFFVYVLFARVLSDVYLILFRIEENTRKD